MSKKILISLVMVVSALALAVGGTIAFFSDTETSVGNTFTAGAIDLRIDSQCTYNGAESKECGEWELKDLGTLDVANFDAASPVIGSERFYNFSDVKPGDYGENTISLHVRNNEAHACLIVENLHNDDPDLTEPEKEDSDLTEGVDQGELAQAINFFAWDDNGNNIWEAGENPLFTNTAGPASDVLNGRTYYLGVIPGGEWTDTTVTQYLGVYWCYGLLTADAATHTLSCSGAALDNKTQTDTLTADMKFYVEQTRHNADFKCPEISKPAATTLLEGSVPVQSSSTDEYSNVAGLDYKVVSNGDDTVTFTLKPVLFDGSYGLRALTVNVVKQDGSFGIDYTYGSSDGTPPVDELISTDGGVTYSYTTSAGELPTGELGIFFMVNGIAPDNGNDLQRFIGIVPMSTANDWGGFDWSWTNRFKITLL